MRSRFLIRVFWSILLASCALTVNAAPVDPAAGAKLNETFEVTVRPFLQSFCLDCHGEVDPEAKLDLSLFQTADAVARQHQTWAIVLERLQAGEMPPEEFSPQPTPRQRQAIVEWIHSARDFEATRNAGDPGPVLARRLSNAEYNYAVRDLTGVDIRPTQTFPVDPANEAGFDNSGESLTMSPALLNKYLGAARQVVEHLVLTPDGIAFAPHPVMTDTDRDKYCVKRIVQFYEQQPTDLADYFFAAWDLRLRRQDVPSEHKRETLLSKLATEHEVSQKYLATVDALLTDSGNYTGPVRQLQDMWNSLPMDAEERDAARQGCQRMSDFVRRVRQKLVTSFDNLKVDGIHVGAQPFVLWKNRQYASHRRSLNRDVLRAAVTPEEPDGDDTEPVTKTLAVDEDIAVPADPQSRARYQTELERFCSVFPDAFYISERGRDYVDDSKKQDGERGRLLSAGFHSMMGYFRDDTPLYDLILDEEGQREIDSLWQQLDFVASAPARQYVGFLWFERTDSRFMRDPQFDFARPENKAALTEKMIRRLKDEYLKKARASGGTEVPLQAIETFFEDINRQIRWVEETARQAQPAHLTAIQEFAGRAWRRTLTQNETERLAEFYGSLREDGVSHEEAIQDTFVTVLMSPHFCYRVDLIGAGSGRRSLTSEELASRLSFFLWSSTPDSELLRAAAADELLELESLKRQTRRMLADNRVRGLATEFAGHWLDFRRFEEHNAVDRERFPEFTDELRQAMFEEPVRFFMDLVQHDRPVTELLSGDYTFVNRTLARHYAIPDELVSVRSWSRVDRASEFGRGGLLPMSVFLTMNAPGLRTSPVKRGYWVVRRLLGERIPPPPPNVPDLPADESQLGELTLRETLARHREHSSCAGCHERFDSIGLAFEGFGPIGEKRERDLGGRPIDSKAEFPGGEQGNGVDGLEQYIRVHRQDEFVDNLIRKLVSYALGRSLILSDELLIRELHQELKANDYSFGSLVAGIVTSPQFLSKRGSQHLARE